MGNEKDGPVFNAALAIPIPDTVSWSATFGKERWAGDDLKGLLDCALQHHQGGPMTLAVSLYFGMSDQQSQEMDGQDK